MSITPVMSGLRRSVCLYRLVWTLALTLGGSAQAAPGAQILSVPAQDTVLQIAVKAPAGQHLAGEKRLAEIDVTGPNQLQAIPAEVIPGRQADGTSSPSEQVLVCGIPPRAGAQGLRRFRLFEISLPAGKLAPAFRFEAVNEKSLGLWEGGRPVFVYNHGILSKQDVPADRNRSTYLHPIYGLDGEVLTDDFPKDHYHHRGLFWAWPHVGIEGTNYDLWDIRGVYQRFERWLDRRPGPAAAILGVENGWYVGERKVVQERVWFTVYPASGDGQVIDLDFTWIPTDRPISLAGAEEKSYGGLTLRYAPRTQTVITTPLGNKPDDLAMTRLDWADLSAQFAGTPKPSGAAIFISPDHPDYPPTWLTRHYGALCVGWPGVTPATFQPGQRIQCRYRLWLHRGASSQGELQRAYDAYRAAQGARWEAAEN